MEAAREPGQEEELVELPVVVLETVAARAAVLGKTMSPLRPSRMRPALWPG